MKSTTTSLDVYSVNFLGCRTIYPIKIVRPLHKYRPDNRKYLQQVLEDLQRNNCHISEFICDNPKRAIIRDSVSHSGKYACEYCFGAGQSAAIGGNTDSTHIVWPKATSTSELRTRNNILDICQKIEEDENVSQAEKKGIRARSLLLDYPNFNFVQGIPTEYMHSVCLGLVKRPVSYTHLTLPTIYSV